MPPYYKKMFKLFHSKDFSLIFIIVAAAALLWLVLTFVTFDGNYAEISVNGEIKACLPLSEDTEITIREGSQYNTLKISNGFAAVLSASCPDKICVHHKAICKTGETIVCLPNRLSVTIRGEKMEVDAVT